MSSTNVGGSPAVGGEANTAGEVRNISIIALANFAIHKDDPNKLSWLDKKALARQLSCTVLPNTTWASLQPSLFRHFKEHKANVHNVDVTWHHCDVGKCTYQCKNKSDLKEHKAHAHNVDVTWHQCDVGKCTYQCKKKSHLKVHKAHVHDIGKKKCVVCYKNCGILKEYKNHGICRECVNTKTYLIFWI